MKHAETVTFGGSHLDRAGEVRFDDETIVAAQRDSHSSTIVFWRGKPLVTGERDPVLAKMPLHHALLTQTEGPSILLGREGEHFVFAQDMSEWEPAELDEAQLAQFFDPSEQHHPDLPETHRFVELRSVMSQLTARDAEVAATAKSVFGWHRSHRFCACCGQESRMVMAGWQRDCPGCGARHFPRTDPVVIMAITHGNAILMGRSPQWPEGMYSLLAGFVEPGESVEAAVRREVWEESGIRVGAVSYLASQPWPYPSSLMLGCHGTALGREITVDPKEIEDALWISREEMLQVFAGEHSVIRPARKGAIAHFILRNWLADRLI